MSKIYKYSTFNEAIELARSSSNKYSEEMNIYGVVLSIGQVKEQGTSDGRSKYCKSYFLADPTMESSFESNVCLNVFADELSQFPVVIACGDILRCHRVKSQLFEREGRNVLQFVGFCNPNKINPSYVTFHENTEPLNGLPYSDVSYPGLTGIKEGRSPSKRQTPASLTSLDPHLWEIHSTSSKSFHWNDSVDRPMVYRYQNWAAEHIAHRGSSSFSNVFAQEALEEQWNHAQKLYNQGTPEHRLPKIDYVGLFLGIFSERVVNSRVTKKYMLFWDGSGRPGVRDVTLDRYNFLKKQDIDDVMTTIHAGSIYHNIDGPTMTRDQRESLRSRITAVPTYIKDYLPSEGMTIEIDSHLSPSFLESMAQATVGTWYRFRNLTLYPSVKVNESSHVIALPPYAKDSTVMSNSFSQKMRTLAFLVDRSTAGGVGNLSTEVLEYTDMNENETDTNAKSSRSRLASKRAASNDISNNIAVMQKKERKTHNAAGHMYSPLALMMAYRGKRDVAKFCVRAYTTKVYPPNMNDMVVDLAWYDAECATGGMGVPSIQQSSSHRHKDDEEEDSLAELMGGKRASFPEKIFMFALEIQDDTNATSINFVGKDAEFFMGISANEFYASYHNLSIQNDDMNVLAGNNEKGTKEELWRNIKRRLDRCVAEKYIFEMYIKQYRCQEVGSQYKRYRGYNTRLPSFDEKNDGP